MARASLRDRIIGQTFVAGEFTFAGGAKANNKQDMDLLINNPELFGEVICRLGALALDYNPDLITYVPNGARTFAEHVATDLDLPIAHLWKAPGIAGRRGGIFYRRPSDETAILAAGRAVLIEDVTNTFLTTSRVLDFLGIKGRVAGQASILHRGREADRQKLELPSISLVSEYIPPIMDFNQLTDFDNLASRLRAK